MPKDLDEIEEMETDSSIVSEDEHVEVAQAAEGEHADSSNATDETEADTLSVVRDVVAERPEGEEAAAASSAEGEEESPPPDDQEERDPDDYSDVPFHKHPRFQEVVREKNAFREDATRYRNVQAFIDQNGLTGDEVAQGFEIMAAAKTDPATAFALLKPFFKEVAIAAGEILPDDLADRVAKKELTRDAALELSRAKAAVKARDFRDKFQQQTGQRQQQIEQGQTLRNTAQNWLNDRRIKDPNFATKESRLHEKIAFLHATEGKPSDVAGVRAQLKKAYDAINAELAPAAVVQRPGAPAAARRPAAQKPAIRPVTGGSVANAPAGKPKSTLDVIRQVAAARGQG